MSGADHFLARWSRLKRTAPAPATEVAPVTEAVPVAGIAPAPDQAEAANRDQGASATGAVPAVALPDPASLTLDSDFTAFLKDEVGEGIRRQALKKLFNDPHFNVMDGLDIYIGDYSVSEPIPPEMLAKLRSASEWLAGREDEGGAPAAGVVKDDAALAAADDAVGQVVGDEMDTALDTSMGGAMDGTADGAHVPAGAMPAPTIAGLAPATAEAMSPAAPPPATTPAIAPAASAADTVKRRQ